MNKRFFSAVQILSGTIIGAGVFSLPYVFSRTGLLAGFFYLFAFTGVYFAIHLMYAGIVSKSDGRHQFFFFAKNYLPKSLAGIASFLILLELVFVLTIYLILAPAFGSLALGASSGWFLLAFWLIGTIFAFVKLEWLSLAEIVGVCSILFIVGAVFFRSFGEEFSVPLFKDIGLIGLLLPFGPILFGMAGRPAISEVIEEHRKAEGAGKPFSLKKAVFWGTAVPALVYGIFVIGMLRLKPDISEDSITGIISLPAPMPILIGLAGLACLLTSYFVVARNVKEILLYDLKFSRWATISSVFLPPLVLYFSGFKDFLGTVSFAGGVFLGLEGIFVVMMWQKAFPESRFRTLASPLYLIFGLAIIYEAANFLKLI